MCNDQLWTVRKACVDILPQLYQISKEKEIENLSVKTNNAFFIKLFNKFIFDQQKYVRSSILEVFGNFISLLEKEELNNSFLDFYKNTIEEYYFNIKDFGLETETNFYSNIIYQCAFNFPAVLLCYGKDYWISLKKVYLHLAFDKDIKVVKCIICSMHEIAKILGNEATERDLLPIIEKILCDEKNSELKEFTLNKLPSLLKLLHSSTKEIYLKYLDFSSFENVKKMKWREKIETVKKCENYFELFEIENVFTQFVPPLINLCLDDVN